MQCICVTALTTAISVSCILLFKKNICLLSSDLRPMIYKNYCCNLFLTFKTPS